METILKEVANELNLPKGIVKDTYYSFWRYIKQYIEALPLMEDLSEEEFNKLQTNFNVPYLGKLYVTLPIYKAVKRKYASSRQSAAKS